MINSDLSDVNYRFALNRNKALQLIRSLLCGSIIFCSIIQLLFFVETDGNAISSMVVMFVCLATYAYTLNSIGFGQTPISMLLILGFNFVSLGGSLIVTTLSGMPFVENLQVPVMTFCYLSVAQLTLVGAHFFYKKIFFLRELSCRIQRNILRPLGFFEMPNSFQLWVMGFVGCASVLITRVGSYSTERTFGTDDAGSKMLANFAFLLAAPFLAPVLNKFRLENFRPLKSSTQQLIIYFIFVVAVSSMANTRSVFADAAATMGLAMMLVFFLGRIPVSRTTVSKGIVLTVFALLMLPIVSRVAIAMVIVREARESVAGADLFSLTADALFNDAAISSFFDDFKTSLLEEYSELYINNPLFSRLIITKFQDNMFYFSQYIGPGDVELLWFHLYAKLVGYLPQPVIDFFGFGLDKADYIYSTGDYIFYLATGYGLGGYRTGSMIAEGFALAGVWFPFILAFISIICFFVYDSFYDPADRNSLVLAPVILLIFGIFLVVSVELPLGQRGFLMYWVG